MSQDGRTPKRGWSWAQIGAAIVVTGLVAACAATPTPYQPRDEYGYGYSEQLLETNRYRITFSGNSDTSRETVENYLLYRAAEVTLQTGNDYFVVQSQQTEEHERGYNSFSTLHYPGFFYSVRGGYWDDGYLYSVDTYRIIKRYEAIAVIKVYKGERPEDNVSAYDARDVMKTLGPRIVRESAKDGVQRH